jgi:hypothetical protein
MDFNPGRRFGHGAANAALSRADMERPAVQ